VAAATDNELLVDLYGRVARLPGRSVIDAIGSRAGIMAADIHRARRRGVRAGDPVAGDRARSKLREALAQLLAGDGPPASAGR
jgi:hypothetical protein